LHRAGFAGDGPFAQDGWRQPRLVEVVDDQEAEDADDLADPC